MWMPSQVPLLSDRLKAQGLELDPAKLSDLLGDPLGAVVSLGGCTASFVSPEGLIATNHHCVTGTIQYHSRPDRNLLHDGFLAHSRGDELPAAPGTYVYVTTAIRDVTREVLGDSSKKLSDADYAKQVERRQRQLVDACEAGGGKRCRVAAFFDGAMFLEITQLEIPDVRFVYAPAEGIGNYGGEVDNWMWPRHTGDFAFLRAYVGPDGKPAPYSTDNIPYRPAHWLRVAKQGVQPGDLVWVAGYPGRTFRYQTYEEFQHAAQVTMPISVAWSKELIALLERENARGKEVELANYGKIRGLANSMKKFEGILAGLKDGKAERVRRERQEALRKLLESPAIRQEVGDPLSDLERVLRERDRFEEKQRVLMWLQRASTLLSQAVQLWRLAEERVKPDLDREDGYRERDWSRLEQGIVRAQRSLELGSERVALRWAFEKALALPSDQRIRALDAALAKVGGADASEKLERFLEQLLGNTKMGNLDSRKEMFRQSLEELAARGDSLLDWVRELAPELAELREHDRKVSGALLRVRPRYLRLLERLAGSPLYPDANGTLRLTFGSVQGFSPRDAVDYRAQTTLSGVVRKNTGVDPFEAPKALLEAATQVPDAYIDPRLRDLPVNFLATCDITGGNSGSPTLNGRGELVGLAFDGNWEGVTSDYWLDPDLTRSIHVDAVYMRWVMDSVDQAHHLLEEMGLPVFSRKPER
jgi:hypothetical protein